MCSVDPSRPAELLALVDADFPNEALGAPAADNCAKMKKGELAVAAAERLADKGWLPRALDIAEPETEAECAPSFDNADDADRCDEDETAFQDEAA